VLQFYTKFPFRAKRAFSGEEELIEVPEGARQAGKAKEPSKISEKKLQVPKILGGKMGIP